MLRVRLLGELAVETDGGLVAPPSRPARELLAWLALHPGAHPRLELASRFWPDVLESSARASLRTALHELRRATRCRAWIATGRWPCATSTASSSPACSPGLPTPRRATRRSAGRARQRAR